MYPVEAPSLIAALLLAWGIRRATGRQWVAAAVEHPARRLAAPASGSREAAAARAVMVLMYGVALGVVLGFLREFRYLLPDPPWAPSWAGGATGVDALLWLGVVRVPPRKEWSPERLARDLGTPWILMSGLGPWAAYGYRAAAAAVEAPGAPALTRGAVQLCEALPLAVLRLAARILSPPPAAAPAAGPARPRRWEGVLGGTLILGVAAAAVLPLLRVPGWCATSEGLAYAHRLWALDGELRAGVWYPRLFPQFAWGFGYPFLNYYAPLSYYLAEPARLAGLSYVSALKALVLFIFAGAGGAMFTLVRERCGFLPALAAAAGYATSGYLLVDLYTRGDLAEALCFVWLPLGVWAVTRDGDRAPGRQVAAGAIPVALLTLSHNVTALLAVPLLLAMALLPFRGKQSLASAAGVGLGLGLAAFFWLPALVEKGYVSTERMIRADYRVFAHFLQPEMLFSLTGERYPPGGDAISFQGSTTGCWLALIALTLLALPRSAVPEPDRRTRWMVLLLPAASLLTLPLSAPFWRALPLLAYVQFPWRTASFACLALSYLAGWGLWQLLEGEREAARTRTAAVLVGAVVTAYPSLLDLLSGSGTRYHSVLLSGARLLCVGLLTAGALRWMHRRTEQGARGLTLAILLAATLLGGWQASLRCEPTPVERNAFDPAAFHRREEDPQYLGTTARAEYLPRWAPVRRPAVLPGTLRTSSGVITRWRMGRGNQWSGEVESPLPATLTHAAFYFPGWRAYLDGRPVRTGPSPDGLITFAAPAGRHEVRLAFEETPIRRAAWALSGAALVLLALCWIVPPGGAGSRSRLGAARD